VTQRHDPVGDRALEACTIAPETTATGDVLAQTPQAWIVVTGNDGSPIGVFPTAVLGRLPAEEPVRTALAAAPPAVVADARTPVSLLLASPAVRSSNPPAVIVRTEDHVLGVWVEDELLEQGAMEGARFTGDWSLPGDIVIPQVIRYCRYQHDGRRCTAVRSFEEKPVDMPACSDPERLGAHNFAW
jgi:hypothetical protein